MATNVEVFVHEDEGLEKALRRFRRKIRRENLLREIRDRQFYRKPSEERRLKAQRAQRLREKDQRRR